MGLAVSLAMTLSVHVVPNSQEYPDLLNVSPRGGEGLSVSLAMGLSVPLAMLAHVVVNSQEYPDLLNVLPMGWESLAMGLSVSLAMRLMWALALALTLALRLPDGATLVWVLRQSPLS